MSKRYLVLEDGTYFEGQALGSDCFEAGELVFNTAMAGYEQVLTDPSNIGEIVVMTFPMIGNFGISREGFEGLDRSVSGLVISECCQVPSNWKSEMTLEEFLKLKNIPAIKDLDTRMISRYIREKGTLKATFIDDLTKRDEAMAGLQKDIRKNILEEISIKKPFNIPNDGDKLVVVDLGSLNPVIKELNAKDYDITVVPYDYSAHDILALHPKAVILVNGPQLTKGLDATVEAVKEMVGKLPIFGVGLGHLIVAKALGLEIVKHKTSNFGSNYPIKNHETGVIESHRKNNSYYVTRKSLVEKGLKETYTGLNLNIVEGFEDIDNKIYCIEFDINAVDEKDENRLMKKVESYICHEEVENA